MGKIIIAGVLFSLILISVFLSVFYLFTQKDAFLFFSDKFNSLRYPILGVNTLAIGDELEPKNPLVNSPLRYLGILQKYPISSTESVAAIEHSVYPAKGLAKVDKDNRFISWLPEAEIISLGNGNWDSAGEVFDWWMFRPLNNNIELLTIQFGIAGTAMVHPFYLYTYQKDQGFKLLLKLIEANSQTYIADLDSDNNNEIIHEYSISGIGKLERDLLRWKDIWRVENGEIKKVNNEFPFMYQSLRAIHIKGLTKKEWEPDAERYYPVLRCLKEKVELTLAGTLAEIDDCRDQL